MYRLVKHGNAEDEMEDACKLDLKQARFAVADGATESSFADLWAKLLVGGFMRAAGRRPRPGTLAAAPLQKAWQEDVDARPMPWYAEDKAAQGAFSTLLGLELMPDYSWHAVAIGDSCLFQVRQTTGSRRPFR